MATDPRFDIADPTDPRTAALLQAYPTLRPADGKTSRHALATKNAKILLKAAYPQVHFKVTSNSYSGGSSLNIYWMLYPEAPSTAVIDDLLKRFAYGEVDGQSDGYNYDSDTTRRAFRDAFGAVRYVMPQPHILSLEEQVAYEQDQLRATMAETPGTLAVKAPRSRL